MPVGTGCSCGGIGAGFPLFGNVENLDGNSGDAGGLLQFGFRARDLPAARSGKQEFRDAGAAAQFQPFPAFGVRFGVAGLAFLFLIDGSLCRPELPLQVRRPGFEAVQFGAGFVGKAFDSGQFRHALALAGLAFAQFAKATLGFSHGKDSAIFESISNNIVDK